MKFNQTLTFNTGTRRASNDDSIKSGTSNSILTNEGRRSNSSKIEKERQFIKNNQSPNCNGQQPLDPNVDGEFAHSYAGLPGVFIPVQNDFSTNHSQDDDDFGDGLEYILDPNESSKTTRYRDESHWPAQKREKVKRFRFVICLLALFGLALGLMSRLILNVSIVEMIKRPEVSLSEDLAVTNQDDYISDRDQIQPDSNSAINPFESADPFSTFDPLIYAADHEPGSTPIQDPDQTSPPSTTSPDKESGDISNNKDNDAHQSEDDGLHFNWSKQDVNIILGSMYIGYMPGIMFSGDLAQRFGAKYPLFLCIFGTAVINVLTPTIARYSLNLLIGSRILLGLIQGSLMPALYELFNRWLTPTESSIFAPMIKVSTPLGSLIGTLMPGILASYNLAWPNLFYLGGLFCFIWSLVWLFVATSMPQTNRFVEQNEINRIMRKKGSVARLDTSTTEDMKRHSVSKVPDKSTQQQQPPLKMTQIPACEQSAAASAPVKPKKAPTPWLKIITNPSVLALTLVKFTYNIGLDFVFLQLAVYLREVHRAPIETISAIASGGYCMQMFSISFVGWIAKIVVLKRLFGFSVTKWRKVFQGGSNILMATSYMLLAYLDPEIELATCLVFCIAFFWMLGAGGESMVPYDLSYKYPASIVGFAHSISVTSALVMTAICGLVLGENTADSSRWSLLFFILACLLASGGLVFVFVIKAKPFLAGESVPKKPDSGREDRGGKTPNAMASISTIEQEARERNKSATGVNGYK